MKHTLIKFLFLLFLFIPFSGNAAVIKDTTLEHAILQEKYVFALQYTAASFRNPSIRQQDSFSYYLFQAAECLFKLRKMEQLTQLFSIYDKSIKKVTPYYSAKIFSLKLLLENEKNNSTRTGQALKQAITTCQYPAIKTDYTLSLASYLLTVNKIDSSELLYRNIYLSTIATPLQKAAACNGIGACFSYNSDFDSAKYYYHKALDLYAGTLGLKHSKVAQVNYNLALIANKFGEYSVSQMLLQNVLATYRTVFGEQHPSTANAYGALGSVYLLQDDLEKALFYITKERDVIAALYGEQHTELAYSYLNTGKIYAAKNQLNLAEQQLNKGMAILAAAGKKDNDTYIQLVIKLADVLASKSEVKKAALLLKNLLTQQQIDDEYKADIFLALGTIYLDSNQAQTAIDYFSKSDKMYIAAYGAKNVFSVDVNIELSRCYLKINNLQKANYYALKARNITTSGGAVIFPFDHWKCRQQELLCIKALLENKVLDKKKSAFYIEEIKDIISEAKRIKQTYYSNGSQMNYAARMSELNNLGVYFLTHFYTKRDAYFLNNLLFFGEQNKANLLHNKFLGEATNELLPLEKQQHSKAIINRLNYFITLNENQEKTNFNINDSVLFYQDKYEQFTKTIEKEYPKIYRLKYGEQPLTTTQIQQQLPEDATFLAYCNDAERYYCLSISKNKIEYKICGSIAFIDSLINQQRQDINNKKANNTNAITLYSALLPDYLSNYVLLSPDGAIHQVAFDALKKTNKSDYFIYKHPTFYAFSAATYFHHSKDNDIQNVTAFFPDYLHSQYAALRVNAEAEAIKLFPEHIIYEKQKAQKHNFIKSAGNNGIMHIAAHLIIDTVYPLQSYLVFQPIGNYKLTINEIWKMNVSCQLVALASCQSNFGKQQNGEGMQNFAWAFHYAGANNILSTQWNASDKASSAIIGNFYRNIKNGKTKQEALQLAKIAYLKNTDAIGIQPYFWANFQLFGNDSKITVAPNFFVRNWYLPILLLMLVFISLLALRKFYKSKKYAYH